MCICIAPCHERTSRALMYGTRSQGISQFYLHPLATPVIANVNVTIAYFVFCFIAGVFGTGKRSAGR